MKFIFLFIFYCLSIIKSDTDEQTLISLELNKLNSQIKNEIYSKDQIHIIDLSIDDTELNGVEIQFYISSSWDSPLPFTSSIKYIELTKSFSTPSQYLSNIETFYLINVNLENNNVFSFSCSNNNNTAFCGFYLDGNLINFEDNKFEKNIINLNTELGYIIQNKTNAIIHYMSYNNISNLIMFLDIKNELDKPMILNYDNYHEIKCINFDDMNFFCLFVKESNETTRNINIKHFNTSLFKYIENNNDSINEDNDTIITKNPFEIDENLTFNLNLINNYAFDLYKTDDNNLIICFLINEENLQKVVCYKNTFEELINFTLIEFPVYKSCDIKKDGRPTFFNYAKISIIYANKEHLRIILYTYNKSKYFIIDLNTLVSYLTKENENFLIAKVSNHKKQLYILNNIELTTKNNIQYLNLIIRSKDIFINTFLEYPQKPSEIKECFFFENELGEIQLTKEEPSYFTLLNFTSDNYHYISLNKAGIVSGTYQYNDIPSPLLFYYQFTIYPQYCLSYSNDALKCIDCVEGAALMPDTSLCFSENEIPDHYYLDTFLDLILKCDQNCFKCDMLKTGGYSECVACDDNFYNYKFSCVNQCPENSYYYSYKRNIKALNYDQLMNINVCVDACEEGYTGLILQDISNNNGTINKLCILNKYKDINDKIEQKFNEYLLLNTEKKKERISKQENIIKNLVNITSQDDFNNLCVEFVLINNYIYILDIISKLNMINKLNELSDIFYKIVKDFFYSLGGENELLKNNNDNLIFFLSALISLFDNEEYLEKIYIEKVKNYFLEFGENITDIAINSNEIDKINIMIHTFIQFINMTIDSTINFIDPDFDEKEFLSNKYYRYKHEIILEENNIRLMNMTKNLFKFILGFDLNLYFYPNNIISFYNQKLSEEENDKEYILPELGFNLVILGSKSKITTATYNTNNISESIENGQISNLKIILPSLKSINDNIDWNDYSFGLIIYNKKYPFLNKNSTFETSTNFISINFYDKNKNPIRVSNIDNKNYIKIVKKKSIDDIHMGNCVYYDDSINNLNDKDIISYDLVDYIICSTNHLSDFTIASFSPSYLIEHNIPDQKSSEREKIKRSHWLKDRDILSNLNSHNAIIIYLNIAIILLCLILLIIKFLSKQEFTKAERMVEDSYVRYTINEDTETDKKILKYIIEKEIDYILKNRSDYENQKKQEMALDIKNDVFNSDQKVITIIEDDSDDDDDEEINEKKIKKVSFRNTVIEKKKDNKKTKFYKKESNYNLKSLDKKKGKNKTKKNKEMIIEMANVKEDNDFIEIDEAQDDSKNQSNKYKYNFNYKNNPRKSNLTNTINSSNHRNSTFSYASNISNNYIAENEENKDNNKPIIKKQSLNDRFKKNVKEQKSRHIYSILDKTLNDIKNTGQNSLESSSNIIKRPSSLIGISNALNKVNNKEEEKILIKNEFFVIFKLILYILYQYEFRPFALFNKISLPITRNNLIFLISFRLSLQLSICIIITPRYFGNNYSLSSNILAIILTIIISDVIYTIIEIILMKKKILTSTDNKAKGIIKFKQIMECLFGYTLLIAFFLFGFYNSLWVSLYLKENKIKCCYIQNFIAIILIDYLLYETLILAFKSLIFTYVVYKDSEGCILKVLEFFNKIFIFYLAE